MDAGGTRIRAARIGPAGDIQERVIERVRPGRRALAEQVLRLVAGLRTEETTGVGVGVPGRVDAVRGAIRSAGYLDIAGLDLAGLVREATGLPCRIENDATMALLAEGRARPEAAGGLIFMITVGTGVGGAALQDGRPWYGGGFSGQFGHIVVAPDDPACACGRRGCVETFSSGVALGRQLAGAGLAPETCAEDLLTRADAGDGIAAGVLDAWSRPLRRAIQSLVAIADPRLVLIGGGLGAAMTRALGRLPPDSARFGLPVEAASLGDSAGVVGAGLRGFQAAHGDCFA